jgi:hypothetical protein
MEAYTWVGLRSVEASPSIAASPRFAQAQQKVARAMPRELTRSSLDSPFTCPRCLVGLGLPRQVAGLAVDEWPVGLRCQRCGHEWHLARRTIEAASRNAAPRPWIAATSREVRPIAACGHCAGLITLEVLLDTHSAPRSSGYACPHCGAAGHVTLPGAIVRAAEAVAGPARAMAS